MNFTGSYTFHAPTQHVFESLLDPTILQECIPGCETAWWQEKTSESERHMVIRLTLPIPITGLRGPYDANAYILESEPPHHLALKIGRIGRIGGRVATITRMTLADEGSGSQLTYDSQIDLEGPIAFADSPIFRDICKHALSTFFSNLDKRLTASLAS